ncbi:TolB family protein [Nonomuraea rhodomycinica]|uniref:Uncharacterized protein n=1 Tax=Nonomuraea rhodomycinica TaxID=1712872 RepID=A0A7Y6IJZ3_9ACTN|nr:hypothetical protein [Nonomuraea rhodomycinica]NUW39115.1 hypothetical protein [Nonomuraea rhodomycinica]
MSQLEEALRRTLAGAAGQAPQAPATLTGTVEARYRRRRNRTRAMLATAAVVAVLGGTAFALKDGTPRAMPAAPPTATLPPAIEKVWPQAIHDLPATLPDGRAFRPYQFIDDRTLLVTPEDRTKLPDAVYAYDVRAGDARKITDLPKETALFPEGLVAGGGRVMWWTVPGNGRGQLWSAPLSGGPARVVAGLPMDDGGVDAMAVAGDRIVFSVQEGGVFTVPLRGGTVKPVKGGADSHLLAWPWIGRPGMASAKGEPMFGTIRNVQTGETDTAFTRPGDESIRCGLEVCAGWTVRGGFTRLRDGSQERPDPCADRPQTVTPGRFCAELVKGSGQALEVLRDRRTGRSAVLGIARSSMLGLVPNMGQRLMHYTVQGRMRLVDLTKIP